MLPYLDIHTHARPRRDDVVAVENVLVADVHTIHPSHSHLYSVGIHPMYIIGGMIEQHLELVEAAAQHDNVIAIGEAGFDARSVSDMEQQRRVFLRQAEIAERFAKPVIIHCVHAYNEVVAAKRNAKPRMTWIVHGFTKHPKLAQELLSHGLALSFGAALLDNRSHAADVLRQTPRERIFLETDTSSCSIDDVYARAAVILEMNTEAVKELIMNNYQRTFA